MIPIGRFFAGAGLCMAVLWSGALAQDAKVSLRFSHWLPPAHQIHTDIVAWSKAVETASNDSIEIKIFPASQLGAAKDHFDMAKNGIADFAWTTAGYTPGLFPALEVADIPLLMKTSDGGSRALNEWYAKFAVKEMADVKLCMVHVGPVATFHTKKPVKRPADLAGMRVRPSNGVLAQFVADNGASAVNVSATEARQALERGIADAIAFPWGSLVLFNIDKSVSHHTDAPLFFAGAIHVMNKATYEKMSAAQKKVIDDHCNTDWAGKFMAGWANWEAEGRGKLAAMGGHTFHTLNADDMAAWKAATQPTLARWKAGMQKAGHDPEPVLKSYLDTLAKHNAAN